MAVTRMTWKDIKLATLQKMFAAEGSTIPSDGSTEDYIAAMPYVANEGIHRLVTVGKPIVNTYSIAHYPVANLLGDDFGMSIKQIPKGNMSFAAKCAKAYFFEFAGTGTLTVEVNDLITDTVVLDSTGTYTKYRGIVAATDEDVVTLQFDVTSPSAVKNIALYDATYSDAASVPEYGPYVDYDLTQIIPDFYRLYLEQVYIDDGTMRNKLPQAYYRLKGGKVLSLDRNKAGSYAIYYQAYPDMIDAATDDTYVLNIDPEVVVLLPLYMASQLYKDDDNGIATAYRNEFEVALEGLQQADYEEGHETFSSKGGWI